MNRSTQACTNLVIERPYDLLALALAHRAVQFNASQAMSLKMRDGVIMYRARAQKGPLAIHLEDIESSVGSCFRIQFFQNGSRLFTLVSPGIGRYNLIFPRWTLAVTETAKHSFFLRNVCSRCGFNGLFRTRTLLSFLSESQQRDWNADPAIEFLLTLVENMAGLA